MQKEKKGETMSRIILLNSSVMPEEGVYMNKRITQDEYKKELETALNDETEIISYIGYFNTLEFLNNMSENFNFSCNRTETKLEDGDELLIIKLKFRIPDPTTKGKFVPNEVDYEYFKCKFNRYNQ